MNKHISSLTTSLVRAVFPCTEVLELFKVPTNIFLICKWNNARSYPINCSPITQHCHWHHLANYRPDNKYSCIPCPLNHRWNALVINRSSARHWSRASWYAARLIELCVFNWWFLLEETLFELFWPMYLVQTSPASCMATQLRLLTLHIQLNSF